jgi:hypothetical protein
MADCPHWHTLKNNLEVNPNGNVVERDTVTAAYLAAHAIRPDLVHGGLTFLARNEYF